MAERLDTMARTLVDLREAKDEAETKAEAAKDAYKAAELEFWETMDDLGLTSFNQDLGEGYGKVQMQKRETIRCIVRDSERAREAIKELDLDEELLGEREIRKAPANEHLRNVLKNGQEIPAGLDFSRTQYVQISRK